MSFAKKYALIDLHLHLDGSLSIATVRAIADMQGIELNMSDGELASRLTVGEDCRDLNEYLEKFDFPLTLLQTEEAISEALRRLCDELFMSGLIYAEIRFAPQLHTRKNLTQQEVVEAAIRGKEQSALKSSLILCCMRGEGNEKENFETVSLTKKFLGRGVCAVDLAGAEALYKNESFSEVLEYANALELPITLHAGEADGKDSVYSAIRLGARRIGHGVRSVEDASLLALLREKKIPLELCPTSNLNTAVFKKIEQYPIRELLSAGVCVTVNTDNTTVSNTSLAREYQILADALSLSDAELCEIAENSARAAFLPDEEREELLLLVREKIK